MPDLTLPEPADDELVLRCFGLRYALYHQPEELRREAERTFRLLDTILRVHAPEHYQRGHVLYQRRAHSHPHKH